MNSFPIWVIPAIYVTIRFVLSESLGALGTYAPEWFDAGVIVAVCVGFRYWPAFRRPSKRTLFHALIALSSGYLVYGLGQAAGIAVPFDFRETETLLLLLVLGPVLEELLFRHALWICLARYRSFVALGISTALFSYAHFHAWFGVPFEFKAFIEYQTLYTFLLGGVLGFSRLKTDGMTAPLLIHIGFNLGFTIAAHTLL